MKKNYSWRVTHGVQNVDAIQSLVTVPFILNPVRSFDLRAKIAKGTKIGVHKHSPVLENTRIKFVKNVNNMITEIYIHTKSRMDKQKHL